MGDYCTNKTKSIAIIFGYIPILFHNPSSLTNDDREENRVEEDEEERRKRLGREWKESLKSNGLNKDRVQKT